MDYILGIVWYALGIWGFVWWWTRTHDFTSNDIMLMLWIGLLGPGSWLMGLGIHGLKNKQSKNVILKRKTK